MNILLLLTHSAIHGFKMLKSKLAMTATTAASYVAFYNELYCSKMAWLFKIQGQSKHTNQLSLTLIFSVTRSQHNNNSIMFESPPSPTVPTTIPPSSMAPNVAPNLVVHVSDASPMTDLTEVEKVNARKKTAKLLRKEQSIKVIVKANKTLFCGQGNAAIIKMSLERKPTI
jgi:hypothetical protein